MNAYRKEGTIEQTYPTFNGIAMLLLLIVLALAEAGGIAALRQAFVGMAAPQRARSIARPPSPTKATPCRSSMSPRLRSAGTAGSL